MSDIEKTNTGKMEQLKNKPQVISGLLLKLNLAYPAQSRSFTADEVKALNTLWNEIFEKVPNDILSEAVRRFISGDRKGYFPSPGQIMGYVEEIDAEIIAKKRRLKFEKIAKTIKEIEKARENGENYTTCVYSTPANECACPRMTDERIYCVDIHSVDCLSYQRKGEI